MLLSRLAKFSDEDIMRRVQHGDERALGEIYKRYSGKLIRYFYRMLWRDEAKSQDFLHDLFLKIIENPTRFDADRKFSTWLYSAAFNMCKNEYRKQNFRGSVQIVSSDLSIEIYQPSIDHKDFYMHLTSVLDNAEESDRNLFILRYELEMPLAEIASTMNCAEGTIKSRIFYLKKKLVLQLRAYNPAIN